MGDLSGENTIKVQRKVKSIPSRRSILFNDTHNTSKLQYEDLAKAKIQIQQDRQRAKMKERLESRLLQRFEADWVLASSEDDDELGEFLYTSSEDDGSIDENNNNDNNNNNNNNKNNKNKTKKQYN